MDILGMLEKYKDTFDENVLRAVASTIKECCETIVKNKDKYREVREIEVSWRSTPITISSYDVLKVIQDIYKMLKEKLDRLRLYSNEGYCVYYIRVNRPIGGPDIEIEIKKWEPASPKVEVLWIGIDIITKRHYREVWDGVCVWQGYVITDFDFDIQVKTYSY